MMSGVHHHTNCITCIVFFFLLDVVHPNHPPLHQALVRKLLHVHVRDANMGTTEEHTDMENAKLSKPRVYMKMIFDKYGSDGLMTFEGFEHLLQNLGLGNLNIADHDVHDHHDAGGHFKNFHDNHHHHDYHQINESKFLSKEQKSGHANRTSYVKSDASNTSVSKQSNHGEKLSARETTKSSPHKTDEFHNDKRNTTQRQQSPKRKEELKHRKLRKSKHLNSHHILHEPGERRTYTKSHARTSYRVKREAEQSHHHDSDKTGHDQINHDHHDHSHHLNEDHSNHTGHEHVNHDHINDTNHEHINHNKDDIDHGHSDHSHQDHSDHDHTKQDDGHHMDDHNSNNQNSSETKPRNAVGNMDKCLSPKQILAGVDIREVSGGDVEISENTFIQICPILLYQIDAHACSRHGKGQKCPHIDKSVHCSKYHGFHKVQHAGHDNMHQHEHDNEHDHEHEHERPVQNSTLAGGHDIFNVPLEVWGFACLSVLVISLVGLLGVAIVPVMQKVFYTQLLQFLIALAIGSLTGDALLHLLPHALLPHNHGHSSHAEDEGHSHSESEGHDMTGVWKGLVGLSGLYLFFQMERLMAIYADWKRKRRTRPQSPVKNRVSHSDRAGVGARLCHHNVPSSSCEEIVEVIIDKKDVCEIFACSTHELQEMQPLDQESKSKNDTNHAHSHIGHSHSHGHSHVTSDQLNGSVASIAWLVIMGDGLHNFTDGLAIGASFSNSITGGISTSVAVFCHELPHELGDFAVLLQAGMSIKKALTYNIVSSVLCFFGMIIGVCVGNITEATTWVFAFTAGTFIYIALVDMLPELTSVETKLSNACVQLVLQNVGLLTGMAIMLVIALYEDKIQVTFDIT